MQHRKRRLPKRRGPSGSGSPARKGGDTPGADPFGLLVPLVGTRPVLHCTNRAVLVPLFGTRLVLQGQQRFCRINNPQPNPTKAVAAAGGHAPRGLPPQLKKI